METGVVLAHDRLVDAPHVHVLLTVNVNILIIAYYCVCSECCE